MDVQIYLILVWTRYMRRETHCVRARIHTNLTSIDKDYLTHSCGTEDRASPGISLLPALTQPTLHKPTVQRYVSLSTASSEYGAVDKLMIATLKLAASAVRLGF